MKKIITFFLLIVLLLSGCSTQEDQKDSAASSMSSEQENQEDLTAEANGGDVSEQEDPQNWTTEVIGSISHGVPMTGGEAVSLEYDGGEMEIEYRANASGIAQSCGFLIFINGIPQPYKVDGISDDYSYLHEFEFREGEEETFTFQFVPVTGKQGDVLSVCITSIINPSFIPDMQETRSYGISHSAIAALYSLTFNADAKQTDYRLEARNTYLSNVTTTESGLTDQYLDEYFGGNVPPDAEMMVYPQLYLDGNSTDLLSFYDLTGKDTVHISFTIFGLRGAEYKNVFYLNHEPLEYEGSDAFQVTLMDRNLVTIEMDLDVSDMKSGNTLYVISVPCNSDAFPYGLLMEKTNSIDLYQSN